MASSATPLHDSLIELAIPDAHAHAIKWYLNDENFPIYGIHKINNFDCTVEARLTDTPQWLTPVIASYNVNGQF